MRKTMNLGIVGCGAITERMHLPTAIGDDRIRVTHLVDSDLKRAESLAKQFNVSFWSKDYNDLMGNVDAVILAVPHYLHSTMTCDFLKNKIHVLCEKPMAISSGECLEMFNIASMSKSILQIGYYRRFYKSIKFLKKVLTERHLGEPKFIEIEEGVEYNWPSVSGFVFNKKIAGGGVLLDTGSHSIDWLLYLFGEPTICSYQDDNRGGMEANAVIEFDYGNSLSGRLELSRTRVLKNFMEIRFEKGSVIVNCWDSEDLKIHCDDTKIKKYLDKEYQKYKESLVLTPAQEQLNEFLESIEKGSHQISNLQDAIKGVQIIEKCYQMRINIDEPWREDLLKHSPINSMMINRRGKILVTGANGFIGGRLVEHLVLNRKANVCAVVHNMNKSARLSTLDVEIVQCDITDFVKLRSIVEGCEIVVHCAYGNSGTDIEKERVTVEGTRNILQASLECGVKKFIHLSTVAVYGSNPPDSLNETAEYAVTGDVYTRSKIQAEKLVIDYYKVHGLRAVILQPAIVYGPYSTIWTVEPIQKIKDGSLILINNGEGICNVLYIDNLVHAIELAIENDRAIGERFIITDGKPITWGEFYGKYSEICGIELTTCEKDKIRMEYIKNIINVRVLNFVKTIMKSFLSIIPGLYLNLLNTSFGKKIRKFRSQKETRLFLLNDAVVEFYTSKSRYSIMKAEKILNYKCQIPFDRGMAIVEKWLRFNRMI